MSIIQVTKCDICSKESRDIQEMMTWTGIQMAIMLPSQPGQNIVPLNFCPDCWDKSQLRAIYYTLPGIVEREADLIHADFQRKSRIVDPSQMEHYSYPTAEEVADAVQDNPEGRGSEDGDSPV